MLGRCAGGFGLLAFAAMAEREARGAAQPPQLRARAQRVIFLYMDGGVSQIDSFDPKPELAKRHGQPFPTPIEPTQFNDNGSILASPWKFSQHGQSGLWVSELFPNVARCVDRLCVVRSMVSDFSEHNTANFFLHTGTAQQGRPSAGAWLSYGLGSACRDLPDFVVINGGLVPSGGPENFGAGFLPPKHQATVFLPQEAPVANLRSPLEQTPAAVARRRDLIRDLDGMAPNELAACDAVESAIANYELSYQMQVAIPRLAQLDDEPESVRSAYGFDHQNEATRTFARECILARRLVERGVRFVELTCPRIADTDRWDAHSNLKANHSRNALAVDQPIAALLEDLASRGLLDDTLVLWAGEFGRTPFSQGADGRDHNPFGFTIWMAGGGVRGGMTYGATDDFGYRAIDRPTTIHDLHATILHLLGIDHTQLTFRYGGRDMRLTDVYGEVVHDLFA
ncbi:MAG: DUF1501 domain-containing protein [Lacipirellulaceae bacterium]